PQDAAHSAEDAPTSGRLARRNATGMASLGGATPLSAGRSPRPAQETRLCSTTTVWISASRSYQRASNPAITAPMIGATHNNQSWPTWPRPANKAGPVLRAGLTEALVTGIDTRWISVSLRPIGIPAKPAAATFDVVP